MPPARDLEKFLHYFCGNAADAGALKSTEALRISFYKSVALFAREYADIVTHLTEAGYLDDEAAAIKGEVEFHAGIRASIEKHAGRRAGHQALRSTPKAVPGSNSASMQNITIRRRSL